MAYIYCKSEPANLHIQCHEAKVCTSKQVLYDCNMCAECGKVYLNCNKPEAACQRCTKEVAVHRHVFYACGLPNKQGVVG